MRVVINTTKFKKFKQIAYGVERAQLTYKVTLHDTGTPELN